MRAAQAPAGAYVGSMRRISLLIALLLAAPLHAQLLVSTDWLQAHRFDKRMVIVEIGDRTSYEAQHIAGAQFIALNDLLIDRDGGLQGPRGQAARVLLYLMERDAAVELLRSG